MVKHIVLNLDANVLFHLQETGYLHYVPLIASLPNISIEITDFVADIEAGNRVYHRDSRRTEAINNKEVDGYLLKILNNAKRLDFTPEFQQFLDGDTSQVELIDGSITKTINHLLASGEAYAEPILPRNKNIPDITIVSTVAGYEVNQDIIKGDLNVALIRTDYKSQGEVAMMEREKACQKSDALRIVVSDDGIGKPHPDYVELLDNRQSVNITTTAGLMRLMEWAYKTEMNMLLSGDKQFSATDVIEQLPQPMQKAKDATYNRFTNHVTVSQENNKAFHPFKEGLKELKTHQYDTGKLQEWRDTHQKTAMQVKSASVEKKTVADTEQQGYSIELESLDGIPKISKVLKEKKVFGREELAATLHISPDNQVLNELYEMFALFAADNPKNIEPQTLGSSQSEVQVSVCLNKQGKPEIYVDNIGAVYQQLYEDEKSGVRFDEKVQAKLENLANPDNHKGRKTHSSVINPDTIEVAAEMSPQKSKTGIAR